MFLKEAALYIHIPFCASLCDYCDFYSVKINSNDQLPDLYIDALLKDIKYQLEYFAAEKITTVFIGGGTPSILGGIRIFSFLRKLEKIIKFPVDEFSIEANPESADRDFLTACKDGGITRLSLGVQTFHEQSRKALNRLGDAEKLYEQLSQVSSFFPHSFCADLMTGLPGQTEELLLDDINKICKFNPSHISLYSLTVEKDTPLEKNIKEKKIALNEDNGSLWLYGKDALLRAGFEWYEVSNFALTGKQCKHNMNYWQMRNWLAAGAGASATIINEKAGTARRFTYPQDIKAYIQEPVIKKAVCEELNKTDLIKETLLMGYRCKDGPDMEKFKQRFGCSVEDCIPKTLSNWENHDKMLFLNSFLTDAFLELEQG